MSVIEVIEFPQQIEHEGETLQLVTLIDVDEAVYERPGRDPEWIESREVIEAARTALGGDGSAERLADAAIETFIDALPETAVAKGRWLYSPNHHTPWTDCRARHISPENAHLALKAALAAVKVIQVAAREGARMN